MCMCRLSRICKYICTYAFIHIVYTHMYVCGHNYPAPDKPAPQSTRPMPADCPNPAQTQTTASTSTLTATRQRKTKLRNRNFINKHSHTPIHTKYTKRHTHHTHTCKVRNEGKRREIRRKKQAKKDATYIINNKSKKKSCKMPAKKIYIKLMRRTNTHTHTELSYIPRAQNNNNNSK